MQPTAEVSTVAPSPGTRGAEGWRRVAITMIGSAWLISSWIGTGGDHPIVDGVERLSTSGSAEQSLSSPMHDFVLDAHRRLEPDIELALWRPDRDPAGLALWWVTESYRLAPRKVYPLLTAAELEAVPAMAEDLRGFLRLRSEQLAGDGPWPPVAVIAWTPGLGPDGEASCEIPPFPDLLPAWRERGCLLRPAVTSDSMGRPQ